MSRPLKRYHFRESAIKQRGTDLQRCFCLYRYENDHEFAYFAAITLIEQRGRSSMCLRSFTCAGWDYVKDAVRSLLPSATFVIDIENTDGFLVNLDDEDVMFLLLGGGGR